MLTHLIKILSLLVVARAFLQPHRRAWIRSSTLKMETDPNDNIQIRGVEWARLRGMEPGYGGIWPGDPNAKKYKVTIKSKKTGEEVTAMVPRDRYIHYYFEEERIDVPIINKNRMCRQGCCTTCAAKVEGEGKFKMDTPLGLMKEFREEGYALLCCTMPRSDTTFILQDEDEIYIKQWAEYFESGGIENGGLLMEED